METRGRQMYLYKSSLSEMIWAILRIVWRCGSWWSRWFISLWVDFRNQVARITGQFKHFEFRLQLGNWHNTKNLNRKQAFRWCGLVHRRCVYGLIGRKAGNVGWKGFGVVFSGDEFSLWVMLLLHADTNTTARSAHALADTKVHSGLTLALELS